MFKFLTDYNQADYASGRVYTDETCTGCNKCTLVCPASALEMGEDNRSRMAVGSECISCGDCTAVCGTTSITISRFYNIPSGAFRTHGRVQKTDWESYPRLFTPTGIVAAKEVLKESEEEHSA